MVNRISASWLTGYVFEHISSHPRIEDLKRALGIWWFSTQCLIDDKCQQTSAAVDEQTMPPDCNDMFQQSTGTSLYGLPREHITCSLNQSCRKWFYP